MEAKWFGRLYETPAGNNWRFGPRQLSDDTHCILDSDIKKCEPIICDHKNVDPTGCYRTDRRTPACEDCGVEMEVATYRVKEKKDGPSEILNRGS